MNWIRTNDRRPEDEQRVLGAWRGRKWTEYESMTYYAADAPDGPEKWINSYGDIADEPEFWTQIPEGPCAP